MTNFIINAAIVLLASVCLVALVKRNLRQRFMARKLRAVFVAHATDLVAKDEFPAAHAARLIEFSVIPGGWLTRYMVYALVRKIVTGSGPAPAENEPSIDQIPANLRGKYVVAVLALALSDSYRCAVLGRVFRGANGWVNDAIREVRPDVDAHATRRVIDVAGHVHARRQLAAANRRLECAV